MNEGKTRAFWESRAQSGDPLAEAALDVINNEGFLGRAANALLDMYAGLLDLDVDQDQLSADLARAHARATKNDTRGTKGLLHAEGITEYHHRAFDRHGLPNSAFGGTPFTGSTWEANITGSLWCGACDSVR